MMYIAFKWLIALNLAMWLGLCCFDTLYLKESRRRSQDFIIKPYEAVFKYDNLSVPIGEKNNVRESINWKYAKQHNNQRSIAFLHSIMFLAGAFAMLVLNKKNAIINFAKDRILYINVSDFVNIENNFAAIFNIIVTRVNVAISHYIGLVWGNVMKLNTVMVKNTNAQSIHLSLLENVNENGKERKTICEQLLSAIDENKNIRLQYQLEKNAKDKLIRYIENTKKVINENRMQYVSFQQLYLVTHRENTFLKCRLKKLADEKESAEKNLMALINEVYRSKNAALKTYCTRFIVHTTKNLLNSDVEAEIRKFLQKSHKSSLAVCTEKCSNELGIRLSAASSLPDCSFHLTEVLQDDGKLVSVHCGEPNLIGLPGEYVFTLRDKNGIIKKMYEYKHDYDSGEMSKIRHYSVFHDKDCMLDQESELLKKTIYSSMNASTMRLFDLTPLKNHRFLTGSEKFKLFLQNSPVSLSPRLQAPPLPCG